MVNRRDHISRLATPEAPQAEPDVDTPHVDPRLVDYLEAQGFGVFDLNWNSTVGGLDDALTVSHSVQAKVAQAKLLQHLRQLISNQVSR